LVILMAISKVYSREIQKLRGQAEPQNFLPLKYAPFKYFSNLLKKDLISQSVLQYEFHNQVNLLINPDYHNKRPIPDVQPSFTP